MQYLSAASVRFCLWLQDIRGIKRLCFAFLLGAAASLALPPFYAVPLCFISFSALVLLTDGIMQPAAEAEKRTRAADARYRIKNAAALGWFFGFGYFAAGLWWLGDAMTVDIAQFGWAIPFAVFGLPAFLACYYALALILSALFWREGLIRIIVLSLSFGLAEYLRAILFTGFPWNSVGGTSMPCVLFMQLDSVIGMNGMNIFAIFLYSLPSLLCRVSPFYQAQQSRIGLSLGIMLLAADTGFGAWRLAAAENSLPRGQSAAQTQTVKTPAPLSLRIRLVQPAVSQEQKHDSQTRRETLALLLELSCAAPKDGGKMPDLIIWPETSVPYLLDYNEAALAEIGGALQQGQILLAGAVRVEEKPQYSTENSAANAPKNTLKETKTAQYRFFNSMLVINSSAEITDYADKVHLVPFGEYLPLPSVTRFLGLTALAETAGPYSAAKERKILTLPDKISVLPLICYEAIFPREIAKAGKKNTSMLVNITNDAWFGNTPGPLQHLAQARLRAVELQRPLLRAANTGISAYIDSYGRIQASLPLNKRDFLDIDLQFPSKNPPYF